SQEQVINPRFTIRESVPEKGYVTFQIWIRRDREMGIGVQAVVDAVVGNCPVSAVCGLNCRTSPVCEYRMVLPDVVSEWISRVGIDPANGCGSVHIPEDYDGVRLQAQNSGFE